jgi:exopolysaccharide biosynthesis protein
MRLAFAALLASVVAAAPAQTWEKHVAPGLVYRMEVDLSVPRVIHALRHSLRAEDIRSLPELAQSRVYANDATKGRETVGELVRRTGAIAGINADFFPFTGNPLGLMVREGELISRPGLPRSVFGWGRNGAGSAVATFAATIVPQGGVEIPLDGFNEAAGENMLCLNNEVAGLALAKGSNLHVVVRLNGGRFSARSKVEGEVLYVIPDSESVPIQNGNAIITATGNRVALVRGLQSGQRVAFQFDTNGLDWNRIDNAVGGGPALLRNGSIAVDWSPQGFQASFANSRHPRTAVGRTAGGDVWWVAVDGRQKMSPGVTLDELARLMLRLGCVDAINLDGGGSTALNLLGTTLNRPSDGSERKVANAVLFFGPKPQPLDQPLMIRFPEKLMEGEQTSLAVVDSTGARVPNAEIFWAASGGAWVDQGGTLRTLSPGGVTVTASVRGRNLSAYVPIEQLPPPPRNTTNPSRRGTGRGGK